MKIIENGVCYLQGYEAIYLAARQTPPRELLEEIFQYTGTHTIATVEDGYKFDCVISRPENVAWLESRRWIVDYCEYIHNSVPSLELMIGNLKRNLNSEVEDYNKRDKPYRDEHYQEMGQFIEEVRHQVGSFELLLKYKNREVEFLFPDEIFKIDEQPPKGGLLHRLLQKIWE